jgi:hypothetical protein
MSNKWKLICTGAMLYSAIISLLQDFIGKEAYIKHLAEGNGWGPAYVTVPLAIFVLSVAISNIATIRVK